MNEEFVHLREFAATGSQEAFAAISRRFVDVVYTAARRQVGGDAHLAEDVTQAVFIVLAARAKSVPVDRPLTAWLLKATSYCAANARRQRDRRAANERRAADMARIMHEGNSDPAGEPSWEALAPLLDEGMNKLGRVDRDALLLRYFENKSLRHVADSLGMSEDAAQKRVIRAVEKLRKFFHRQGATTLSATALATMLAGEVAQAAPVGLATTISATTATAATTVAATAATNTSAASVAKGAIAAMTAQKAVAITVATAAVLLVAGGGVVAVKSRGAASAPRTVVVASKPSATQAAGDVTFSDGTTVRLLGITEVPARSSIGGGSIVSKLWEAAAKAAPTSTGSEVWWTADGSIAKEPPLEPINVAMGPLANRRVIRMVFEEQAGKPYVDASVALRTTAATSSSSRMRRVGSQTLREYYLSVPSTSQRMDMELGLAAGPWQDESSVTVGAGGAQAPFTIDSIRMENGTAVVEVTEPRLMFNPNRQRWFAAILKDQTQVRANSWGGSGITTTVNFPCDASRIERIVIQWRPFEWRKLSNVLVNPSPDMIRQAQHRYALAHPQIIRDRAQKLFEDISKADYSQPEPAHHFGYTVNHDMPAWWAWVCSHFATNPITKVELGQVKAGAGGFDGWPVVAYALTLKDGTQLTGVLPVQYDVSERVWNPQEGLDWHLPRRPQ